MSKVNELVKGKKVMHFVFICYKTNIVSPNTCGLIILLQFIFVTTCNRLMGNEQSIHLRNKWRSIMVAGEGHAPPKFCIMFFYFLFFYYKY